MLWHYIYITYHYFNSSKIVFTLSLTVRVLPEWMFVEIILKVECIMLYENISLVAVSIRVMKEVLN